MKARTPPKADTRELRAEMNWYDWVEYCGDVLPQRLVRRVMDQGADLRELLDEHLGEDPTGYLDTKLPTPVIAANEGSSGTRVGDFARFHSGGSMQVSIFNRRYSSSRRP